MYINVALEMAMFHGAKIKSTNPARAFISSFGSSCFNRKKASTGVTDPKIAGNNLIEKSVRSRSEIGITDKYIGNGGL